MIGAVTTWKEESSAPQVSAVEGYSGKAKETRKGKTGIMKLAYESQGCQDARCDDQSCGVQAVVDSQDARGHEEMSTSAVDHETHGAKEPDDDHVTTNNDAVPGHSPAVVTGIVTPQAPCNGKRQRRRKLNKHDEPDNLGSPAVAIGSVTSQAPPRRQSG